jgi:hypothetical protein
MMEAVRTSVTLVRFCQITRRDIPEDSLLHELNVFLCHHTFNIMWIILTDFVSKLSGERDGCRFTEYTIAVDLICFIEWTKIYNSTVAQAAELRLPVQLKAYRSSKTLKARHSHMLLELPQSSRWTPLHRIFTSSSLGRDADMHEAVRD